MAIIVMAFAPCVGWSDEDTFAWTGISAAPNYRPVPCTNDGSALPTDSVKILSLTGNFSNVHHTVEFYNSASTNLEANVQVNCPNGVQLTGHVHGHRHWTDASTYSSDFDVPYDFGTGA